MKFISPIREKNRKKTTGAKAAVVRAGMVSREGDPNGRRKNP
jgi:hypothetical protein